MEEDHPKHRDAAQPVERRDRPDLGAHAHQKGTRSAYPVSSR
jgi:hypothetical protein